jgi:hypothetical protein
MTTNWSWTGQLPVLPAPSGEQVRSAVNRGVSICHNAHYASFLCKSNIEMTPLCKIEVTLPRVLGFREVRLGGGVNEQAGVQPS